MQFVVRARGASVLVLVDDSDFVASRTNVKRENQVAEKGLNYQEDRKHNRRRSELNETALLASRRVVWKLFVEAGVADEVREDRDDHR